MASKEFLTTRIQNCNKNISKSMSIIKKKQDLIAKKEKELETLTDENEIYWKKADIKWLEGDIAEHERKIEKEYKPSLKKYTKELEEVNSVKRDIPVLVDFLNQWKKSATEFYTTQRTCKEREELLKNKESALKDFEDFREVKRSKVDKGVFTKEQADNIFKDLKGIYEDLKYQYMERFGFIISVENEAFFNKTSFEEELEKILQKEWESKYDKLVEDVTSITGTIKDASGLSVSSRGELNGVVIGDKGKAKVTTFLAGGWNIQCLHYRLKVTKVN